MYNLPATKFSDYYETVFPWSFIQTQKRMWWDFSNWCYLQLRVINPLNECSTSFWRNTSICLEHFALHWNIFACNELNWDTVKNNNEKSLRLWDKIFHYYSFSNDWDENSHPFLILKQKRKPNSTYLQKFDPRNMNNFHQNNSQKCWQYPGSATLQFHHQLKLLHWHGVVMIGEVYWFYCSCSARVQVRVQT